MPKPIIPFWMTPKALNLSGPAREEARANYELIGIDRDKRIAEINFTGDALAKRLLEIDIQYDRLPPQQRDLARLKIDGRENDQEAIIAHRVRYGEISQSEADELLIRLHHPEGPERELALLDNQHRQGRLTDYEHAMARLQHTHSGVGRELASLSLQLAADKISQFDHDIAVIDLTLDGDERDVAKLAAELQHNRITKLEHDKQVATLREEPWIGIIDSGFDPDKGVSGVFFEFDWNEQWIAYLRENGYSGPSDAAVVDGWFIDVCRAQGFGIGPNDVVPFGR